MEERSRSGEHSGIVVKSRSQSGCLIVRKKADVSGGPGSTGIRKIYESKTDKKRSRMIMSDSGSSDELVMPPRRRLDAFNLNEYGGLDNDMIMRRNRFGYGGDNVRGRRLLGSMPAVAQVSIETEYESGPSRHAFHEKKKKNLYLDKSERMKRVNHDDRNRFRKDRDGIPMHYPLLRERYMVDSDEHIRVQGKNGVLKEREKEKEFDKDTTTKKNKVSDCDLEDSDTSPKLRPKDSETSNPTKRVSSKEEKTQVEQLQSTRIKEGKVRRGCGTEKQKLRTQIRGMLQEAGWTIDYRPRRNRHYLDAVYINPSGTAYWSIIKAYDALLKQLDEDNNRNRFGDGPAFAPLSDKVLSQLTRKTGKKREMKKKIKDEKVTVRMLENLFLGNIQVSGMKKRGGDLVSYSGKRTLLAWLIDSGAVQLSQKVLYMNYKHTKVLLEGWITRDGIHCGCCSKILTISKFEIHAGSKLRQPFQNIYLDSGVSLLQCQIDAWNRQVESEQIGYHSVDVNGDDPNDDTCGICGDGGDLICCDSCPSTLHQSCLNMEFLPAGDWQCPYCICKVCANGRSVAQEDDITDGVLLTCSLCEKRYHKSCIKVTNEIYVESNSLALPFCGQTCSELFECLQKYLGVKHELEGGFSWSLIRRIDADSYIFARGLPQRVECNSKLAVALTVMDECFLPIVDRRSGINLVKNVLYNCGSNFNRLNYSGFYTAILERGDEIISAASIRFHGTQLAEMPFIGTRHIYRHQGMFRRLFGAIESALCSLKVHKLVIPAIAEITHTWTAVFGFTTLEESVKQEMRSMNMLVFPGIAMLQKVLLKLENTDANLTTEPRSNENITPEVANGSEPGSSSGNDTQRVGSSDESPEPNNETALTNYQTADTRNLYRPDSKYDASPSSSHDALDVQHNPAEDNQSDDGTDSQSGNKATESASDSENTSTSTDCNAVDKANKTESDSGTKKNTPDGHCNSQSSDEGDT
ncbi:Imidazoleglycerol-phosphate dehydratase [Hibiscus syriacus]|uniref:Imidazoleglycerol-phosphate dehydratase n=1 Tax=Hibiscus syriacus TaxID=106335 RepID=A0A6A2XPW5_HIBSY|nr:Imidazoleglycerol-phosphate dehydratase [Hibiscus syriacus]